MTTYPTEWCLGKIKGSCCEDKNKRGVLASINIPQKRTLSKYFAYSKCGDKDTALQSAKQFCREVSDKNGMTRNQIRYMDADTIEVKLTQDKTFITDAKYLDLVEKFPLWVKFAKHTGNYYVVFSHENKDGQKKKTYSFTALLGDFYVVKFINGNSLDLRQCNLEKGCEIPKIKPEIKYNPKMNKPKYPVIRKQPTKPRKRHNWVDPTRDINRRIKQFTIFEQKVIQKGGICLSTVEDYKTAHSKLKVQCADQHEFLISKNNLNKPTCWCPACSIYITELITIKTITHLLGKPFEKCRPDWLINPISEYPMELDGYNEELKIAVEYNGKQHYEFSNFFHSTLDKFNAQLSRDNLKRQLCKEHDIFLIEVPYTVEIKDIAKFISDKLFSIGLDVEHRISTLNLNELTKVMSKTDECKNIIESKNGKLIEGSCLKYHSTCIVECEKGHQWKTKFQYIKRGGWCQKCTNKRSKEVANKISMTLKVKLNTEEGKLTTRLAHEKRSITMAEKRTDIRKEVQVNGKICRKQNCDFGGEIQPACNFGVKEAQTDGLQAYCKTCQLKYKREWKNKKI